MRTESLYKFCTPNTSEVLSSPVSKQRLLWMNLHEFLCIDRSFSEAVLFSFFGNLVEAARQPVPYHCIGSRLAGVLECRGLGCKRRCRGDHKLLHSCMYVVWSLRSVDHHCCVLLSCLQSVTAGFRLCTHPLLGDQSSPCLWSASVRSKRRRRMSEGRMNWINKT